MEGLRFEPIDPTRFEGLLIDAYLSAYRGLEDYAYRDREDVSRYLRWLRRRCGDGLIAAFVDDQPIGLIACDATWNGPEEPETGELHEFFVHGDWQGHGIGRQLFEAGLDYLARQGCRRYALWVGEGNVAAQRLYERYGFERTGQVGVWVRMERREPWEPAGSPRTELEPQKPPG